ncbi:MAG: DUF2269 domain-containing protein, partial [Rhodobacteraceae bacterium]|nr:DUF2269 domain-containing protein [Paracoccaceae bacterium]
METVLILRWLHVMGATVLIGTGAGIAFFMFISNRSNDAKLIAHTASIVVLADTVFTLSAVIIQPITGTLLALEVGWALSEGWIALSLILYLLIGLFWLPVVWIQLQMRNLARQAAVANAPLPARYHRLYRVWFLCGIPAFAMIMA